MQNRSKVVGLTQFKNKPSRNAFDKTHRNMFTTNFGQLLPIFTEWMNPGETIKLGYNGFTRTQPLQTAAFTRLKENVQYFFVPFQSLWKYFEVAANNMSLGQNGQSISPFAAGFRSTSSISTKLPYVSYSKLHQVFSIHLRNFATSIFEVYSTPKMIQDATIEDIMSKYKGYFKNGSYNYVLTARLLGSLGYGNFSFYYNYDLIASIKAYSVSHSGYYNFTDFAKSEFGFAPSVASWKNAPNLSLFPLLAYHRIVNDFYQYRHWQPIQSWKFNIDYINPSSQVGFDALIGDFLSTYGTMFDMEFSNLPLDYLLGVLPSPQFGDESVATIYSDGFDASSVGVTDSAVTYSGYSIVEGKTIAGNLGVDAGDTERPIKVGSTDNVIIKQPHRHRVNMKATVADGNQIGSLRISELRNALALQKYKEIQNANDSDFVSQVLAHFGVKPSSGQMKSRFITGGDSVLQINPEVNQNLTDGANADIKATCTGSLSCSGTFTADTYGIVIGIYRCTPVLDYAQIGIDRNLFKTDASDFPIPEFDSVGMQTQYQCELVAPSLCYSKNSGSWGTNSDMSATYGYLPRYAELKTSFDRFSGAFADSLRSWVTGLSVDRLKEVSLNSFNYPFDVPELLKCTPSLLKDLFVNTSSLTSNDDKLLVGSVNTAVLVRPYSVYGLPFTN